MMYGWGNMMGRGYGSGFGLFGMLFGWVFTILFFGLIVWGIVVFVRWMSEQTRHTAKKEDSAIVILKERYAKGEIDKKEFEEKMKNLQK